MPLSDDQVKRVEYIQQKYKSLDARITSLEAYLKVENRDPINAKLRLESLAGLFKEYMTYNDELSQLDPQNPLVTTFIDVETRYFDVSTAVTKIQKIVEPQNPQASSTLNSSTIVYTEHQAHPRLREIQLDDFDGKREKWPNYKNKFITFVHDRTDINDAVKASHLFSSLKDQALAKVSHYDASEADYQKAWQTLLDVYDRKRIVAIQHLNAILDLPRLPPKTKSEGLSLLIDNARQHLHILDRLGSKPSDELVVRIIERCLPPGVSSRWQDRLDPNVLPKLDDLFNFIQNTIFKQQALEDSCDRSDDSNTKKRAGDIISHGQAKSSKHTSRSLVTTASNSEVQSSKSPVCVKCQKDHWLFRCEEFDKLANSDKWKFVNQNKVCRNCLGVHPFPCKSDKRCKRCSKAHHTKLHNDKNPSSQQSKVPSIADTVRNDEFPRQCFEIPKHLQLADPQFHLPKSVDLLLASNIMLSVLSVGQIKLNHEDSKSEIILQKTRLGWIIAAGNENCSSLKQAPVNVVKLDKLIERFWRIEDFSNEPIRSREEVACEEHYVTHTTRDPVTGRYTVRLPFKDNKFQLGNSRRGALSRYYTLEQKFQSNPEFKAKYTKVMEEYLSLGHMSRCEGTEDGYYLPHHAVLKESSNTTKLRVVFDASAKTSSGLSLNDTLMVGPTIQNTIFEQVLSFRTHMFVVTADIEKMYRQIPIHPDDRKFLKILWPDKKTGKLVTFALNTVTFGTAPAPFLAIRTIQQLARDEARDFPRASKLLLSDFYVDDFVSGADSLEEILAIRDEMIELLRRGGFQIRQWASNHPSALDNISDREFDLDCMVKKDPIQKTLGIIWDANNDKLRYTVSRINLEVNTTKRKLLSETSKIFDPLGLLGPVILYAKVLMQDCWKAKVTWDESLPQSIYTKWKSFSEQLPLLEKVSFPRYILMENPVTIDLHGFCDASERGYGACLYVKAIDSVGHVSLNLICSKSKVAPVNRPTMPRLELCAAVVLRNLYVKAKPQLGFPVDKVYLWSDATIVLCWIKKDPSLLRVFEANRVQLIQTLGKEIEWRHIRSEFNPADPLSRGQLPSEFIKDQNWMSGPKWLSLPESEWPKSVDPYPAEVSGLKQGNCLITTPIPDSSFKELYSRFSTFERLIRVVAYILRWRRKSRSENKLTWLFPKMKEKSERISKIVELVSPLLPSELIISETKLLSILQQEAFSSELRILRKSPTPFKKRTHFDKLDPFIGKGDLIRVGGRLKKSEKCYEEKHPILLPHKHELTHIIIRQFHEANLHAGISTTLYVIRQKYFILNGKAEVRRIVRRCVDCLRRKPININAQMADLPSSRVVEAPPFCHTGVDYFGPLSIKKQPYRNKTILKVYGCVFICMATKAVHIELAEDLSTEGFLMVFRRFVGRRGVPAHMYSDNGTNFVGASRELREIYDLHKSPEFKRAIGEYAISKRIEWHFNPLLSPHFGGIWEAAVKSFKHHLKRIVHEQLTGPQLNTLSIEIEAILNSRPICALSADPNDPLAVTPAHLLIGRPFNVLPKEFLLSVPENRLSTYQFITKARQNFWDKWHKEYLHQLQIRQKWHSATGELKIGSVVILMDDVTYCSRWPLGVIVELHAGSDEIARVASVKTASGTYKRNITRLCVLPVT